MLNKRGTMPALEEQLSKGVQEVIQFFPIQSHPTFLPPELRELFLSTFPPEVGARLLSFYHDRVITARAPRRPSLVALLRCTWASLSADLLARQTKQIRKGLQRYVIRDHERITRERLQAGHPYLAEAFRPPSLGSQPDSD